MVATRMASMLESLAEYAADTKAIEDAAAARVKASPEEYPGEDPGFVTPPELHTHLIAEKAPGYHLVDIPRGTYGEIDKIVEEALELQDAHAQGVTIMVLAELSDIIGAIGGYLQKHHPTVAMTDLMVMASVTNRAFESGARRPRLQSEGKEVFYSPYDLAIQTSQTIAESQLDRVAELKAAGHSDQDINDMMM